jgi:valyl-tRNA synthetase
MELPQTYDPQTAEEKWQKFWEKHKIFAFDEKNTKNVFSIDTPPPYASADHLHVGHGMHYSQFEFVARFQRMRGKNVFFPMGFDDNGLPTETYVEKKYNINKSKTTRADFIKLCLEETKKAGETYRNLFTRLGFSLDWSLLYQTIDERSRRVGQKSFLLLHSQDRLERTDYPAMWCMKCQTTIAQADLEDVDASSYFNDIIFTCGGKDLVIATTRPELLAACVALFYHPQDKRYHSLKGKFAKVPLFDYEVPILADESVEQDKGTGLMMVCTFGDKADIEKWHKFHLPIRVIFTEYGKLNELAGIYKGLTIKDARKAILEDLKEKKYLIGQKQITHAVNVHERCATEIEFLKKPQWQIKILDKKEELIEMGQKVKWYPDHMRIRYEHWVKNLQWNWVISRQRHYGVPFPVWYCQDCGKTLLAEEKDLPVDPREQKYKGKCSCGSSKIEPEMDVMDTWMISSCTPEINADWGGKKERKNFLPMSLRPNAHDIIRTWDFYTIVKGYYHRRALPWMDVMISGHGQDPHGRKMSKSKDNFVVAQDVIKKYSADAFRFWAASVTLGEDLPYQEKELVAGQKFITKLWNASRLIAPQLAGKVKKPGSLMPVDRWLLSKLQDLVKNCTGSFSVYQYSIAKKKLEDFFWHTFCDYYLEIVKDRLYNGKGDEKLSAQYTLSTALLALLKLLAPIMPHITEELYQLLYLSHEKAKSIHISSWPETDETLIDTKIEKQGDQFAELLSKIRKFKSDHGKPLNSQIDVWLEQKDLDHLKGMDDDFKAVAKIKHLHSGSFKVEFINASN